MFIKNLKEDIKFLFDKLSNIRKVNNEDFRQYRKTVDSLIKTFDSLNRLHNYNLCNEDTEYYTFFLNKLKNETEKLQSLKEIYKNDNYQFRCLNDAYLKLVEMIYKFEKYKPIKVIYIDVQNDIKNKKLGIKIYSGDNLIILYQDGFTIKDYANVIKNMLGNSKAIVYIDINGCGLGLYENLQGTQNIELRKLNIKKNFI